MTLEQLGLGPVVIIESLQVDTTSGMRMSSHIRACFAPGWLYMETRPQGEPTVEVIPAHRVLHAGGVRPA
ncbi:hypothetical protein [Blastococcus xanthinilyticus]|uniref:Uncharacterized protein n=1 Tax=Blastococcus xanthinilyticus TaxID=1564164 RepID=A0A5S5CXB6_9ACTN|nr:hypothetical protein [Blastococcus xanthinilyticus]TYP88440.1 hypothetical protein BD833_104144 [Blastococcus xanthinilyticus]